MSYGFSFTKYTLSHEDSNIGRIYAELERISKDPSVAVEFSGRSECLLRRGTELTFGVRLRNVAKIDRLQKLLQGCLIGVTVLET